MPTKDWGNATWLLFHTIAAQIDETKFEKVKSQLIDVIIDTCDHLPCPMCTQDAGTILKKAYIHKIKTKDHFIEFLRQFHNIVNIKLDQKTFSKEEIKDMYNNMNLITISNNFVNLYLKPTGNMKMIIHTFHRQNFMNKIIPILKNIINNCLHK